MSETIKDEMVVAIAYTLTVDGEVVDEVEDDSAIEYLHGEENIVPGLEKALEGKKAGDSFEVTIDPDDGYGEYDEDLLETLDKAEFDSVDELKAGLEIELEDEDGDWFEGVIKEVTDDTVVLDLNPPLAGKTLHYKVKVMSVREATEDELDQGFPDSLLEEIVYEMYEEDE